MQALRYFPNGENKLALVNLADGNTDAEFVVKKPEEVVIQVYNAGLCGTDIHIVQVTQNHLICTYHFLIVHGLSVL